MFNCLSHNVRVRPVNSIDHNIVAFYIMANHGAINSDMQTFNLVG